MLKALYSRMDEISVICLALNLFSSLLAISWKIQNFLEQGKSTNNL